MANEQILAALRAILAAGGPSKPVVSGPRPPVMSAGPRKPTLQPEGGEILGRAKTIIDLLNALPLGLLGDVSNPMENMDAAGPVAGVGRTLTNGMYSRLDEAAKMLPKKGVPASGVMNWLKKSPEGINPEEAAFRKLDQWLSSQGTKTVTPEMLASHLQANPAPFPQVKTRGGVSPQSEAAQNISEQVERISPAAFDGLHETLGQTTAANARLWAWSSAEGGALAGESIAKINALPISQAQKEAIFEYGRLAVQSRTANEAMLASRPKFAQYQVPGGENYRETLLTLPHQAPEGVPDGFTLKQSSNGQWGVYGPGPMTENRYGSGATPDEALEKFRSLGHTGKPDFRSSHFPDDPNLLVHTRANDRTLPSGEPGRFMEEVQSDWHQKGKEKGYVTSESQAPDTSGWTVVPLPDQGGAGGWRVMDANGQMLGRVLPGTPGSGGARNAEEAIAHVANNQSTLTRNMAVPDAPFKDTWPDLGLKQQLIEAANDPKAEWLGFTGGKTQADRYDLSKQINALHYAKSGDGYWLAADLKDGGQHAFGNTIPADQLADHVGKEMAERIREGAGVARDTAGGKTIAGLDLQVGGEGMYAFYDQKLPKRLEKIVKPFGGTVEPGKIPTSRVTNPREELIRSLQENDPNGVWSDADNIAEFGAPASDGALEEAARTQGIPGLSHRATEGESMWMSRLTPEMKEAIKRGVPLMSILLPILAARQAEKKNPIDALAERKW